MTEYKRKIPAPLTEEELKEKVKTATIVMPEYAPTSIKKEDKISAKDVRAGKEFHADHIGVRSVGYHAATVFVDGNGKEYKDSGGCYICINWSVPNFGFGEMSITAKDDGTIEIDTETLGKDFAKAILCDLVDRAECK